MVPVIHDADGKRLRAIAREISDLARRARSKQLGPTTSPAARSRSPTRARSARR
jgi:pyruvate/2-oxoglutarate dehydrogenase complex dihydrolipoamide acyltransferase (E2) component